MGETGNLFRGSPRGSTALFKFAAKRACTSNRKLFLSPCVCQAICRNSSQAARQPPGERRQANKKLTLYQVKRDFSKTVEPSGKRSFKATALCRSEA